ncbi:helix-turn-helix domain-containing protein [Micrococcus luteus]|uniref:helix-turn-helix domain-containing protein n=1 Tax=Micrococcus luteus TaxID=1270 RepID=UPI00211D0FE6|nr:helix-turn-helix domain-containing protein [Micrococcus luteus]
MKWAQKVAETGQLNTGQAFVLLLLGDHADEAWSCHPSQELLARRSAQTGVSTCLCKRGGHR